MTEWIPLFEGRDPCDFGQGWEMPFIEKGKYKEKNIDPVAMPSTNRRIIGMSFNMPEASILYLKNKVAGLYGL